MNIIYVHIPKCAGIAMRKIFPLPSGVPVEVTHWTLDAWRKFYGDQMQYVRSLTVVRHPCDRFVSAFYYLKQQDPMHQFWAHDEDNRLALASYDNVNDAADHITRFCDMQHFLPMVHWGAHECDIILRYEYLHVMMPNLPRLNVSNHGKWQDELTAKSANRIKRMYKEDMEKLNYE